MEMLAEVRNVSDRTHFIDALHYRLFCWLERDVSGKIGWQSLEVGQIGIATDVGSQREENQDRVVVLRSGGVDGSETVLAVVCDGMGGMQDGRTCASLSASGMIVSFLRSHALSFPERLQHAAREANHTVFLKYGGRGGATMSAICCSSSGTVCGLNVGDSRIYAINSDKLAALSVDDTIAGQVGHRDGGPEASSLLQYVGIGPEIEPHLIEVPDGVTRLVLTTDGAHFIPHDALFLLAAHGQTALEVSQRLVQAAQWMGSRDNGTVACIELPLRLEAASVERSIRLCDPWGEMHFLNPADHRPSPVRHDALTVDQSLTMQPDKDLPNQPKRDRSQIRKRRKESRKASDASLPLSRTERQAPTVEITEVIEPPSDGKH